MKNQIFFPAFSPAFLFAAAALLLSVGTLHAAAPAPPADLYASYGTALKPSPDFNVKVNGQEVFTELFEVPTPKAPEITPREVNFIQRVGIYLGDVQRVAIARFDAGEGATAVEIALPTPSKSCKAEPEGVAAPPLGVGSDKITVSLSAGQYLQLQIDEYPPLLLIAEKLIARPATKKNADNVRYFGPGIHRGDITAQSGETIYIAAGAIVYGKVVIEKCTGVKVLGNGLVDATQGDAGRVLTIDDSSDIEVRGLMLRSSKGGWMCVPQLSNNLTLSDLKILGFGANNDGIDVVSCNDVNISGCYIRSTDDCISVKTGRNAPSKNISIGNCTFNGFASSDGVIVGYEARSAIDSVTISDCRVIACHGPSPTGGKAPFSVICDGPGPITNILFERCRIGSDVDYKNLELSVTNGAQYVNMEPGKVDGVTFRDVHWARGDMPMLIWGHSPDNRVTNVLFENCTIGGQPMSGPTSARLVVNRYTDLIKFVYGGEEKMFRRF